MSAGQVPGAAVLYTPSILALAVELADYPLSEKLHAKGEAASRVCGSRIRLGLSIAPDGAIAHIGAQVTACAIGQAAATLFLRSAPGRSAEEIAAALAALEAWLAGNEAAPDWPGISGIAPARAYPARHAAILLPWKAALAALSNPAPAG